MLIDGFTVAAQAVNFIILVWLLKRFLYKPILDAIDAREAKVSSELSDAETRTAAAEVQRKSFEQKSAALDRERHAVLEREHAAAEAARLQLLADARAEAEAARGRWVEALRSEQATLHDALSQKVRQEVFAIARRALRDLADADLEERIVTMFVRRLAAIDEDTQARLASALSAGSGQAASAVVRSAFELSAAQRESVREGLRQSVGSSVAPRFEVSPALVSGVELSVGGLKVAWSIAEYLQLLEESVGALVDEVSA